MKTTVSAGILKSFAHRFADQYCDRESIRQLCAFDDRILERIAEVGEQVLLERHATNGQIIKLIRKRLASSGEMAGFYILYPINKECEHQIEQGFITKSRQISTEQICEETTDAAALYISMVYGVDRQVQAYLIYLLYRDIKQIVAARRRIRSLYVRPVTAAGLRAIEKHNFRRLREDSGIYRRVVTREEMAGGAQLHWNESPGFGDGGAV